MVDGFFFGQKSRGKKKNREIVRQGGRKEDICDNRKKKPYPFGCIYMETGDIFGLGEHRQYSNGFGSTPSVSNMRKQIESRKLKKFQNNNVLEVNFFFLLTRNCAFLVSFVYLKPFNLF